MKIRSKQYPSVTTTIRGTTYEFENYVCDIPLMDALYLLRDYQYEAIDPLPAFNPDSWLKERKLLFNCPFGKDNGFGNFSEQTLVALSKYCDVYAIDTWNKADQIPKAYEPETLKIFKKNLDRADIFHIKVSLYHDIEPMPLDYTIGYTMFETSRLPQARVPVMNAATRMWVPCEQNVQSFKDSGVVVPIDKMPLGFASQYYTYIDRPIKKLDEPYVFGTYGGLTRRKGIIEIIEAFRQEFTHGENVRFVNHNTKPVVHGWEYRDPRIEYNLRNWTPEELRDEFMAKVDCGVFPTKGEGWGLPSIEMAATGCPVIVTNWSGPAEYMNDDFLKLDAELEPVWDYPPEWGYLGDWAKVDIKQLRRQMRWAYENREVAKAMGKRASEYLHATYTWDNAAKRIVAKLDELATEMKLNQEGM